VFSGFPWRCVAYVVVADTSEVADAGPTALQAIETPISSDIPTDGPIHLRMMPPWSCSSILPKGISQLPTPGVDQIVRGHPEITGDSWEAPARLRVRTSDGAVDWTVEMEATTRTRIMSATGSVLPMSAWRNGPVLRAIGAVAGPFLGVGKVQLTGTTSNRQHFDANPLHVWYVADSHAVVEGEDLGPVGALTEQAHLEDFYFPQRGMFSVGRVFIVPLKLPSQGSNKADSAGS
jgi:hypothetical protein